jgi:aldehyde dehydrogenase (NAD+)
MGHNDASAFPMASEASGNSGLCEIQRAFFESGRTRPLTFRRDTLRALAAELERRTGDALEALAADLGKPALEAWLAEIHFTRAEIRHFTKKLRQWAKPRRCRNPFYFLPARSEIRREPFGRVLVAGPWNYPLQLALGPLVAAVGAGNCVTLKPSELAPATSRFLAELVAAVFDPGHVSVVEGGAEIGASLLEEPFDFLFYTGGEQVGRIYAEAGARQLIPVTLELGGKCPCVVDRTVDLDLVVERVVTAKFFNAGQTCVAPDFVLVPSSLHDSFLEKAAAEVEVCYGASTSPDLARIVNERHYDRLQSLIPPHAIKIGNDDRASRYLAPRIVPKAAWDSPAMQAEIFGPVLPVIAYDDLDAALGKLSNMPSPLAVYAFSKNRRTLEQVAASVRSGAVCFNDTMKQAANQYLPLGGVGPSGMGRYHGHAGFRDFTYERAVTRRWQIRDLFLVKPPYGNRLSVLRRFLGR